MRALIFTAALLLLAISAEAACWCDPRHPGQLNACYDNWEVLGGGSLGFSSVCSGAPPACVALALAPPACAEPSCQYYLTTGGLNTRSGIHCIPLEPPPPFLFIWPNVPPGKELIFNVMHDSYKLLAELKLRLAAIPAFGPQWRGLKMMIASVSGNLASMIQVSKDPPNPDFAHYPPLPALPPLIPLVASGDLTPAQASAINAWAGALRSRMALLQQWNRTVDSLSGAMEAAPTSASGRAWVVRLARQIDALGDLVAAAGTAERALRGAIVAAYPPVSVLGACFTAADLAAAVPDIFGMGADAYEVMGYQSWVLAQPCAPPGIWPAVLNEGAAEDAAVSALFANLNHAGTVCAATGYCSVPLTAPALTAPTGTVSNTTMPAYTWSRVEDATYYFLWVNGPDGSVRIQYWYTAAQAACATSGPCGATPAVSVGSGAHAWWVQAWSPTEGYGPFSAAGAFTVDTQLIYPAGTQVAAKTPTYTWHPTPGATFYYLWVNDPTAAPKVGEWVDVNASPPPCVGAVCTWTPSTPLAMGAARWWVHPWNASGYLPWSVPLDFTR